MQIGIFAKTFNAIGALPVLQAVSAAGFTSAQFNLACLGLPSMPDSLDPADAGRIGDAARHTNVDIAAISGTYNMIHPDPTVRADGLRRLEIIAQNCQAMRCPLITLCTGTRDPHDQWRWHPDNTAAAAWSDLLDSMGRAVTIAERYGVDLGIEPELANVVSNAMLARRLLDEMGSPRLCIVLDPANLFEVAEEVERRSIIAAAVDLLGPDIAMAHAKDRAANGDFVAAGTGVIDFSHFIKHLKDAGFEGPLITHGLSAAAAPVVADFLRKTLDATGTD